MPKRNAAVKSDYWAENVKLSKMGTAFLSLLFTPYVLIRILFLPKLVPLEQAIINSVLMELSEEDAEKLKIQLKEVSIIQRQDTKRYSESTMFRWRLLYLSQSSKRPFKHVEGHCIIFTTVKFKVDQKTILCDLINMDGVLAFFLFNKNIRNYSDRTDIEIIDVDTDAVVIDRKGAFVSYA